MNHITLTGVVTKSNELQKPSEGGASLLFHVSDSAVGGVYSDVWFIVKLQGKVAESVADDIWPGQIVTIFGRIREPNLRETGAIIIHAKDVIPHILDEDEDTA